MRLLNIKTLKLEWFHNADAAPSYAILSHRWEDEEVLFEDVEERLEAQKLRRLQTKLEETEQRLDALTRKIEELSQPNHSSYTPEVSNLRISRPLDVSRGPAKEAQGVNELEASGSTMHELRDQTTSKPTAREKPLHVLESQQRKPKGWAKVLGCCKIAEQVGISYIWIDTCCIDKSSSSELSESINSMFAWYRRASLCIAYLSDATQAWGSLRRGSPRESVWFTRGWTLQELIAPKDI